MKAIVREKYGSPNEIEIKEVPKPEIGENDVLVQVKASSVSRTDCGILRGMPFIFRFFIGFTPKPILGSDFAGIVVDKGLNVTNYKIGDRVWGFYDQGLGSQAEYMKIHL